MERALSIFSAVGHFLNMKPVCMSWVLAMSEWMLDNTLDCELVDMCKGILWLISTMFYLSQSLLTYDSLLGLCNFMCTSWVVGLILIAEKV